MGFEAKIRCFGDHRTLVGGGRLKPGMDEATRVSCIALNTYCR